MILDPVTQAINNTLNAQLLANAGMSVVYAKPLSDLITANNAQWRLLAPDAAFAVRWQQDGVPLATIVTRLIA